MARITQFGVDLADDWFPLPSGEVDDGWSRDVAARAVSGLAAPDDALLALAAQLEAVKGAVDATGVPGATTAVLVRPLEVPVVQAMLTIALGRSMSPALYEEQLSQVAEAVPSAQVMGRQDVTADLSAGAARGAHFLIGHLPADDLEAGVHLEERVHLAVFPPESGDAVDVTVIAASIGVFEDFAAFVVDVLQGLDITVGDA
jgi:hypothetical protein